MNHHEFIGKLCLFYREPMKEGIAPNEIPNVRVTENTKWLRRNVPQDHLADLFAAVVTGGFRATQTVPFPLPDHLEDIYASLNLKSGISSHEQEALDIGRVMTPKDIYTRIWSIRDKENPTNAEIDFIHTWDMLGYHYGRLQDLKRSEHAINEYCEQVKQTILRGDKPAMGEPAICIAENIPAGV